MAANDENQREITKDLEPVQKEYNLEGHLKSLIPPAYYPTEAERIEYARGLLQSGQVQLFLDQRFDALPSLRDKITAAILVNIWLRPSPQLHNELPLQAGSVHRTSPATLLPDSEIPGVGERVAIVSKPVSGISRAHKEVDFLRECKLRGISVIEPLGIVELTNAAHNGDENDAYVLTYFRRGIVPLSTVRLEGVGNIPDGNRAINILNGLGAFIADFQNKGLSHGDLHPGNIGLDLNQESSREFILFDLERSQLLGREKLRRREENSKSRRLQTLGSIELGFLKDLAKITAYLVVNNPGINNRTIREAIISGYNSKKTWVKDILEQDGAKRYFEETYQRKLNEANLRKEKRIL